MNVTLLYPEEQAQYLIGQSSYDKFKSDYGFDPLNTNNMTNFASECKAPSNYESYVWTHDGKTYNIVFNPYLIATTEDGEHIYSVFLWEETEVTSSELDMSSARELQSTVSAWYLTLRNIALVALLSILVYIGIRITLSSVASEKAKYKQMLGDWVVALCLVFLMHYIMSFAVTINGKIIKAISSITVSNIGSEEDVLGTNNGEKEKYHETTQEVTNGYQIEIPKDVQNEAGVQLFIIEDHNAVVKAYDTLVGNDNEKDKSGKYSTYFKYFSNGKENGSVLFWPANDFMTQARMLGQDIGENESQTAVARAGYNIIYTVLVIYTVIFCFTYLKRVIYMAFLTIIAPLVAITYPIDKMHDGKAQAFDMWLKEYIFNLLIQPMHLILYTILVGSAMRFASKNIFYVVVALGFLIPAEKLLRRFFGFEKAQTPGMFAGAAGSALMMSGLNKLMHPKPPKGGLGPGGSSKDSEEEKITKPTLNEKIDSSDNLFGEGGDDADDDVNTNIPTGGRTENGNPLLDAYDENYGTDEWDAQERDRLARETNNNSGMQYSDDEYRQILRDSGYSDQEIAELMGGNNNNTRGNNNTNSSNNNSNTSQSNRKRSIRRAIGRGTRNYFKGPNGLGNKMIAKHRANGGFVRRGARMAAGVAAAGTLAAAGGIIGITSGDPSKAAQYMAAGVAGGYALGKGAVNNLSDTLNVKDTLKEAKKGYYGDEYKKHEQEKYEKQFIRNEENLQKIEDKLHLERKDAKKKAEELAKYTRKEGINGIDDALAVYRMMENGTSERNALLAAGYNNTALGGKDTRNMESRKDHEETYKQKLMNDGVSESQAEIAAQNFFRLMDQFNELKS